MKKVFKFFAALASVAAVAGGAYLVYKNFFAVVLNAFFNLPNIHIL